MKELRFIEMWGNTRPTTKRHIPEELNHEHQAKTTSYGAPR